MRLAHFGSVDRLRRATPDVGPKPAALIHAVLHGGGLGALKTT